MSSGTQHSVYEFIDDTYRVRNWRWRSALQFNLDFGGAVGLLDLLLPVGFDVGDGVGLDLLDDVADGLGFGIRESDAVSVNDDDADRRDDEGCDNGGLVVGRVDGVADGLRDWVGLRLEGLRVLGAAVGVVSGNFIGLSDGELLAVSMLAMSSLRTFWSSEFWGLLLDPIL